MKISTRCEYGIRAVFEIAKSVGKTPIKRKHISEKQKISESYLENILIILKNQHMINAVRGANGGYTLNRPASEITLYDVVSVLEGSSSIIEYQADGHYIKGKGKIFITDFVWRKLSVVMKNLLKSITFEKLVDEYKNNDEIDYSI